MREGEFWGLAPVPNKQTRGGASIKLVPLDSPNHGAYIQTNFGPLDPYRFFAT